MYNLTLHVLPPALMFCITGLQSLQNPSNSLNLDACSAELLLKSTEFYTIVREKYGLTPKKFLQRDFQRFFVEFIIKNNILKI